VSRLAEAKERRDVFEEAEAGTGKQAQARAILAHQFEGGKAAASVRATT